MKSKDQNEILKGKLSANDHEKIRAELDRVYPNKETLLNHYFERGITDMGLIREIELFKAITFLSRELLGLTTTDRVLLRDKHSILQLSERIFNSTLE